MRVPPATSRRPTPPYTARHRHQLPSGGHTGWSEGVPNRRHSHAIDNPERSGYVEDSVGSPVHRHAWNRRTPKQLEHAYTSGPVLHPPLAPAIGWLSRVLRR